MVLLFLKIKKRIHNIKISKIIIIFSIYKPHGSIKVSPSKIV